MQEARVWLAAMVAVAAAGRGEGLHLLTYPSGAWKVPEDTVHSITVSLRFNESEAAPWGDLEGPEGPEGLRGEPVLEVTALHEDPWRLDWHQGSAQFSAQEVTAGVNKTLTFSGYYWGTTHVRLYLTRDDLNLTSSNLTLLRDDLQITVDRGSYIMDTLFVVSSSLAVLINNVNMGAQLDLHIIKSVLQRPVGPTCGFVSQFLVMPLGTYLLGQLLLTDPLHQLGLFTLGCCPGGILSNFWTIIFNGDINLSITMTTISTMAAMGMMPLWMFTLGRNIIDENANITIPFTNLAVSLVSLTVPILAGVFIRLKRPAWADKSAKIIKPFSFCILLFLFGVGGYNSHKAVWMLSWNMFVAGVGTLLLGYSLGASLARLVCLPKPQIVAVSLETAFQNMGVAFVLLKLSLESPFSDLASTPVIMNGIVSSPPLIMIYLAYLVARRCCGCCPEGLEGPGDPQVARGQRERERGDPNDALPLESGGEMESFLSKSDK